MKYVMATIGIVVTYVGIVVTYVGIVAGVSLLMAWPFLWLWNYAVVQAVSVTTPITYWPAFWLMMFVSLFFVSRTSSSK